MSSLAVFNFNKRESIVAFSPMAVADINRRANKIFLCVLISQNIMIIKWMQMYFFYTSNPTGPNYESMIFKALSIPIW